MSKRILVITGSPRPDGNSNKLAEAFIQGALASGNTVEVLNACSLDLDGCHGDGNCVKTGYCGLKDDGMKLHSLLCKSDVLVLVTPVYWKSFSSQIKTVVDRLFPYASPKGRELCAVKESILIATAKNPDPAVFRPLQEEYDLLNKLLKFECRGMLLASGLGPIGALEDHPEYIREAVRLAMKLSAPEIDTSNPLLEKNHYLEKIKAYWL